MSKRSHAAVAIAVMLVVGAGWTRSATAAPDWTTPVTLSVDPTSTIESAYAAGGVEFSVRTEVTMPIDLDNVSTRLIVSRTPPGGPSVDELTLTSTTTALPLGGVIAVTPSGAAVVAFIEAVSNDYNPPVPFRWRAVYRAADGTWEAPVTLFTDLIPTPNGLSSQQLCAIAPDGTAVAGAQRVELDDLPNEPAPGQTDLQLDVSIHPAGGTWQASQRLSTHNESVDLTPGLAVDDAGNFTIAWASRFSEGGTNMSNDDRRTILVRRKLAGQSFWNAIEDVTGSDITKDAFFAGRGMGLGPDGRAVVAFQYGPGYKLWAASRSDSAHTFGAPVQLVTTGATSAPLAVGVAPDGAAYVLYTYQGNNSGLDTVGMVKQAPGAAWTSETPVAPLGHESFDGGLGFDGNDAIAVWTINDNNPPVAHLVEANRWPAGAGSPEAFRDLEAPGVGVSLDSVVSDRAGSVVATWSTNTEVHRAAYDHGGPILASASVPNPLIAGLVSSLSATLVDLWSTVAGAPVWDFGDGTAPATGTPVLHTFAASGTYTIMLTASDSLGNQSVSPLMVSVSECESLGGIAALQCRCDVGLGIAPCTGKTLPRALNARFKSACAGVVAAASGTGKKARRGAGRAANGFKKGGRVLGSKAGKKLDASCRDPLATLLSTARDNATTLKGSL